jgi:hypothetical protein
MMENKLSRLKKIGFTAAGSWKLTAGVLTFELHGLGSARNVLYAFVVDGELVYVGKSVQTLRTRMNGYKNPGTTQSTNIKNNKNIREALEQGKQVEIHVLPDNGLLHYGGFHVNLAAGLEDSVVRELSPLWNGGQKESANQALEPTVT